MTINVSIQYNGGLLPDIILLTQCHPILYLMGYTILPLVLLLLGGVLHCSCFVLTFWCPSMTINESIQYNRGVLPDIILLTQCCCCCCCCHPICCLRRDVSLDTMLSNTMLDVVIYCLCFLCPSPRHHTVDPMLVPSPRHITLLAQCYCHRRTRVNAMERFRGCRLLSCSLLSHLIGFSLTRIPCSGFVFIVYVIVSYYYHDA